MIAEWTTQATIVIDYTGDNWTDVFVPITYEGENTEDHYRIRELDMFGQVVLSADELGDEGVPMAQAPIMIPSGSRISLMIPFPPSFSAM